MLTCQACVSDRDPRNPGMLVRRIPFITFQYVSPAVSSVTPFPCRSSGGFGNIPCAMAVTDVPGEPWQTAQLSCRYEHPQENSPRSFPAEHPWAFHDQAPRVALS